MLTAKQFTTKYKISCNGCYFQKSHLATCTQKENNDLLVDLWQSLGSCLKKRIIYILKDEN